MISYTLVIFVSWFLIESSLKLLIDCFGVNQYFNKSVSIYQFLINIIFIFFIYTYDKYQYDQELIKLKNQIDSLKFDIDEIVNDLNWNEYEWVKTNFNKSC